MSADVPDREAVLWDARDEVVRWRRCEQGLLPHRREPLLHERLWLPRGRWLDDREDGRGTVHRVGLDASDRVRVVGPDRDPAHWRGDDVAAVIWDGASSRVVLHNCVIDYLVDDAGRVVEARMTRGDDVSVEQYRRDDDGRVVFVCAHDQFGWDLGGTRYQPHRKESFAVEHDERGPLRVRDAGRDRWVVWERCERPWPELLAEGAHTIARLVIDGVAHRVGELDARGTEVFSLMLVYVDQGSLHIEPASFGLEADRRTWLGSGLDGEQLAIKLFYPIHSGDGLDWVDVDWDDDLDWLLLREASLNGPEDPYTTVLDEVCRVLAGHDWDGLIAPTEDFVVYCAEHDEDITPKIRAMRAANPPARLAAWEPVFAAHAEREAPYEDLMPVDPDRVWC